MIAKLLDGSYAGASHTILPGVSGAPPQYLEVLAWYPKAWITFDVGEWEGDIRYQYAGHQEGETAFYVRMAAQP